MSEEVGVVELVAALRAGKLDLGGVLTALARRGVLPEAEYHVGVETLQRLREERVFDDETVTTLVTRMQALRDAATVVAPPPPARAGADEATVFAAPAGGDATRVVPPAPDRTGTTAGTAVGTDGWERIAEAAAGEAAHVGMLLKGRFLLERELGRGGMGVVFLARDERKVEARDRDPYVAVKVLNDEFRRHPDSLVALQREARRSQRLAHDNIVRVYDFDKDATIVFMTMEYIDGADLRTLIREQAWQGMPLARARPLIEGMARALARAHAAGVVHSDFKPGNVMVTADGVAKVFDFGIARAGHHGAGASGELTVFDAATLGALTPAYASLEMLRGGEPTPADDVYALGCVCFELLTGQHPFGKASAEVALREGRVPPKVPGLSRRQYRTLCRAVAFHAGERLQTVEPLLEGLREIGLRERLLPLAAWGTAFALLAGGGAWALARHLHARQLAAVVAGFDVDGPDRYADETAARDALSALDEDERHALVLGHDRRIEAFLLRRLDELWKPELGRFEYARAQQVFALRDDLRLYSPELDARRARMELQKDELLNALDTELAERVEAGALFEDRAPNAGETLARVRAIDPASPLLRDPGLETAYAQAVAEARERGDFALAGERLRQAQAAFPESLRLDLAAADLAAAQAGADAAMPRAAAPLDAERARALLSERIAAPSADPAWRADVAAALQALRSDASAAHRARLDALGRAIAHHADGADEPVELAGARALVDFGLEQVPASVELRAQQARLAGLTADLEARLARDSAAAETAARSESLRRAAAAGDLSKAGEALQRLRALQSGGAFATVEGPQLLANAYLAAASRRFAEGRADQAAQRLAEAEALLGERLDLRTAKARYDLVALLDAAAQDAPTPERLAQLGERLRALARTDAEGLAALEADLRERGRLPEGTLQARLEALAPAPRGAAGAARPAPRAEPVPVAPAAAPAAAPVASDPDAALPPVPDGPDPCDAALAGRGRFCFDAIGEGRGPTLVVVPGRDGGRPYALGRAEVTVNEFNAFCSATGRCRLRPVADAAAGTVAVSGVPLAQARAYARWLAHASGGWRYRLPTDAEWTHAARAAAGWRQAEDSHCIPPGASAGGAAAPVSARGRAANPWGLINLSGNLWEWTDSAGAVAVRGGAYTSFWSDCTVEARRSDSGAAQADVGFRVLRELK
ncbi:bifunctional serine/threonine-protein kinase/formylglycine-generating enzyme family protein [Luteimonas huabeiensis]|uniref:bifunctional serine/threonine-protein kinase/formylglycine-generating enzyme family protein n=1 Tax=Luteimonas huabeiensis TaxID=1244513 RepID=UPI000466FB0C|nr:bifunctional serine/threonine-protein kinase/formylglycine-generating enzyme family protein [Luteimonas huabeiensis]